MVLLQQMGILFVYMMIGYVACKKEYFDQEFGKKLSWLVVNVANPMLAISAVVNNEEQIAKKDFYVTILLAICFYAFFLILAQILPRLIGVQKSDIGVYKMMTTFNNIGFMGFPVIAASIGFPARQSLPAPPATTLAVVRLHQRSETTVPGPTPDDLAFVATHKLPLFVIGEWARPAPMWEVAWIDEAVRYRTIGEVGEIGPWQD